MKAISKVGFLKFRRVSFGKTAARLDLRPSLLLFYVVFCFAYAPPVAVPSDSVRFQDTETRNDNSDVLPSPPASPTLPSIKPLEDGLADVSAQPIPPDTAAPIGPELPLPIEAGRASQATTSPANESSILRNRLSETVGPGESPEFRFPDIHDDPVDNLNKRFGFRPREYDRFVFPRLVNLIYEDRWLLAEPDPRKALENSLNRRTRIDIRDPDPDIANFPNGAYTLPKGRMYIENSPLGMFGASPNGSSPRSYQWEFLLRYGLTDNLELRLFSNGLSRRAGQGKIPSASGFSPLAFDFKVNFWEENTRYFIPAMGVEMYILTDLGSTPFNSGTQPSINLLFDQSLPFDIGFEYNFGIAGVENDIDQITYQFSYQWSLQREVAKDFDLFFHGFYNAAALPRVIPAVTGSGQQIPDITVIGGGGIWTINDRLAVFGSYNFGVTPDSPQTIALFGFALAF
jgi:hypothetical protein